MKFASTTIAAFLAMTTPAIACFNDSECSSSQICQCPSSSPTGNCDAAGICIPRGSEDKERADAPSITQEEGLPVYKAEGDDVMENPMSFLRVVSQGNCGPRGFNGLFLALENTHGSKAIWVTYGVSFYYQGRPYSETHTGRWSSGRTNPLGCTVPGPTGQRFTYRILSARF